MRISYVQELNETKLNEEWLRCRLFSYNNACTPEQIKYKEGTSEHSL